MAAAVVPAVSSSMPSVPYAVVSAPDAAVPAKRRLVDRGGERVAKIVEPTASSSAPVAAPGLAVAGPGLAPSLAAPLLAPAPIVTVRKTEGAKRPQMKYDPSVPMSKEATSAWRREQRRKRNRESAASCRKRQRDRISELEAEVDGWKAKFEEALGRLEEADGEEAAKELSAMLERTLPVAPQPGRARQAKAEATARPEATKRERCSALPGVPQVAASMTSQALATEPSHVVSPVSTHQRPKFIPPVAMSSKQEIALEDLAFPILEDPILQLKSSSLSLHRPKAHPQGIVADSFQDSRVENGRRIGGHLTEKINARPATSKSINHPTSRLKATDGSFRALFVDSMSYFVARTSTLVLA